MAHAVLLREAFEDFIADKQYQGVSPATISFYARNWRHFVRDTGVETFEDLTTGVIRSWLLAHQGVTPTTLATYDRSLRVTLNWFEKRGYVVVSPMKVLPKRRTPRTRVDTFTLAEAQARLRHQMVTNGRPGVRGAAHARLNDRPHAHVHSHTARSVFF